MHINPNAPFDASISFRQVDAENVHFEEVTTQEIPADGNTMVYLEKALSEYAMAQGKSLDDIKAGITDVSGEIEKKPGEGIPTIVASTYSKEGRDFYQFDITWEMKGKLDGKDFCIRCSQCLKTPIKLPLSIQPSHINLSKYQALMYIKTFRHVHKAALDPKHQHYKQVVDSIKYLRTLPNNQIRDPQRTAYPGTFGHVAYKLNARLDSGKDLTITLDNSTRELDKTSQVWKKNMNPKTNISNPESLSTAVWNWAQMLKMDVQDKRINAMESLEGTKPKDLVAGLGGQIFTPQEFERRINTLKRKEMNEFDEQISHLRGVIWLGTLNVLTFIPAMLFENKFVTMTIQGAVDQYTEATKVFKAEQDQEKKEILRGELKKKYENIEGLQTQARKMEALLQSIKFKRAQQQVILDDLAGKTAKTAAELEAAVNGSGSVKNRENSFKAFKPLLGLEPPP